MVYGYLVYLCLSWFNLGGSIMINQQTSALSRWSRSQANYGGYLVGVSPSNGQTYTCIIYKDIYYDRMCAYCEFTLYIYTHIHIHIVFMYLFLSSILGGQLVHGENTRSKLEKSCPQVPRLLAPQPAQTSQSRHRKVTSRSFIPHSLSCIACEAR